MPWRAASARFLRSCARGRHIAAAGAVVLALVGCSAGQSRDDAGPSPGAAGLPEGVTVAVTQLRSDVADRQVEVQIRNGSDAELRIGAVRLEDPRFSQPATRVIDRTSVLASGGTVNVRVQLSAAACDVPDEAASTATIDWESGEKAGTGSAEAPEVFPFLAALHRRECVQQRVERIAHLAFSGFAPSAAGEPAALVLQVRPTGAAGKLVVTAIRETNLLSFADAGPFPLEVAAQSVPRELSLPLLPARCDPHAVQEDKRGTVFTVDVQVDGDAGQFTLAADPEMRGRILAWVTAWCGYG